jgi:hypothetical protein
MPLLGETPEVKGLWSAAAIWIKEAPGIAKTVAEWVTDGEPEIDPHGADIARFYDYAKTTAHIHARTAEGYNKTYGIVHPAEQWASNRNVRLTPMHASQRELDAEFYETAGWERPHWYARNAPLVEEYGDRVMPRAAEWESRWWSPIINAEHLAMRDRVGIVDLSAFALFDVTGRGALRYLQGVVVGQLDVPVGPGGVHAGAERRRRDQGRPDHHAFGGQPLPGGHRRCLGHVRQEVVRRSPPVRRLGAHGRRDVGGLHGRRLGTPRPRPAGLGHRRGRIE